MKTAEFLNHKVWDVCAVPEFKGSLFGIELELEGKNVALRDVATKGWSRHAEPSLRGNADNSIEYTLTKPETLEDAKCFVDTLFKKFEKNEVIFKNSVRTSTHVHLNFSDKTFKQVLNFFSVFTILEDILATYSGDDRKGNLFCISSREAEGVLRFLSDEVSLGKFSRFAENRFKYAACNLSTLFKFGTIEIRTMRGASSAKQVNDWLDILNDLYTYSLNMTTPADLITDFSHKGSQAFLMGIFSKKNLDELMSVVRPEMVPHSLMEGCRLIQIFAFEFDADFKKEVKVQEVVHSLKVIHPFGHCVIYKPDGCKWLVSKQERGLWWCDGDRVSDDERIEWSEADKRFIVRYPDGAVYKCNWALHPEILNEGPPKVKRNMPKINNNFPDFEPLPEPEFEDGPFFRRI